MTTTYRFFANAGTVYSRFAGVFPTTPAERLNGIQEVSGSIPLISTNPKT